MRYSRWLTAIIIFLFCRGLTSQTILPGNGIPGEEYFEQGLSGTVIIPDRRIMGAQHYPSEEWIRGNVRLTSGIVVRDKLLRYNGYLDELFWLTDGDYSQVKVDRQMIDEFVLMDATGRLRFTRIIAHAPPQVLNREVFAQVLYEGKVSLYNYRRIIESGKGEYMVGQKIYGGRRVQPSFLYVIVLPCGNSRTISKIRRNAILNLFPENRGEIRRLLRQNRLRPSNEKELAEVVELLDHHYRILEYLK